MSRLQARIGERVLLRRQRWSVVEVRPFEDCALLTLRGIGATNAGICGRFVVPFDVVEPLEGVGRLRAVSTRRWRRACRALIAADGSAASLQTAARARIDLLPHQLEPAIAVVRGRSSRILIADEVGLGKTIQAGLAISELLARGAADRILVLTPAGLRDQWAEELGEKFAVEAAIVDAEGARRRSARLPVGINPWATVPVAIASMDYVKRPEVLSAVAGCRWDVVVIDEAHGVAPATDRYEAVGALCASAAYVLLLTATPHSGDRRAFASLCALGSCDADELLIFRRSRADVAVGPLRRVHRLCIRPSAAERQMYAALEELTRVVRAERPDRNTEVLLGLAMLHKRAWSSAYSLEQSIARRLEAIGDVSPSRGEQLMLPLDDGETDSADAAPGFVGPMLADRPLERRLLENILVAARSAATHETKLLCLGRLLQRLSARGEPALVFTEYRDTLLHVRDVAAPRATILHGGLDRGERRAAVAEFVAGRAPLLLATDAAGEGLNLHRSCRVVVNLELPWNPVRLEQRIGRVDRIGQQRTVHAVHLVGRTTGEERILGRLQDRLARARADLGAADPLGWLIDQGWEPGATEQSAEDHGRDIEPLRAASLASFGAEAAAEHRRLAFIRQVTGNLRDTSHRVAAVSPPADVGDTPRRDTWLAFDSRGRSRRRHAPALIAIFRSVVEDPHGRVIAARLVGVMINTVRRLTAADAERVPRLLRAIDLDQHERALQAWMNDSIDVHHAFWDRRISRELTIARSAQAGAGVLFQAGLFDGRAERDRQREAEARRGRSADAESRVSAAAYARNCTSTAAQPVLVLVV